MKKIDVLVPVPMHDHAIEQLESRFTLHRLWAQSEPEAYLDRVAPQIRALACPSRGRADAKLQDRLTALEIIACFGVGYDQVDVAHAANKGIIVTNTPDVLTDEVADTAVGLLMATLRQLPQADRFVREGKWLEGAFPLTSSLRDRTVGIVGLGRIGTAVAHRLRAFGVPVVYHSRNPKPDLDYPYYASLQEMATAAEVLIVTTTGGASTRHLVDERVLRALGPRGVLINVSRGNVVDEQALVAALANGDILTAGLDVFEEEPRVPQPLIEMEHVVLLPHLGSGSTHTRNAMGDLLVRNLVSWFKDEGPLTPVAETPFR